MSWHHSGFLSAAEWKKKRTENENKNRAEWEFCKWKLLSVAYWRECTGRKSPSKTFKEDWSWRCLRKTQIQRKLWWGMNIKATSSKNSLSSAHSTDRVWLQVKEKCNLSYSFSTIAEMIIVNIWTSNRFVLMSCFCSPLLQTFRLLLKCRLSN